MIYKERIKQIRQARGYSQEQLAERLGTSQPHYHRYENGKTEIPASRIADICRIFNVSADWLLGLTDHPQTPA